MNQTDFLVIGTGIAGLTAAHFFSQKGKVTVLTKGKLKEANTYWAQGGIAAVLGKTDRFKNHIEDTMSAGAHHNDRQAVRFMVENAPKAIRFLQEIGVEFQEEPALEAGHSHARVWRTSDFTGQDILNALIRTVKKNKGITVQEDTEAMELIVREGRCDGAFIRRGDGPKAEALLACHTILATGGLGQLFSRTTNTFGSSGDGLALAINAGLEMKDLEFIQFHPTAFARPTDSSGRAKPDNGRYFLLSEALRGFGAKILDQRGEQFLKKFDERGELAPRDIVARAVYFELMEGPVYLSMRHLDLGDIREHFPNIYKRLKSYGLDLAFNLIPITPVAHYSCGGVPVNLKSETKLPGLYAVGEVACTGVHGANRLASNSLLEAVVFAEELAAQCQSEPAGHSEGSHCHPDPLGDTRGRLCGGIPHSITSFEVTSFKVGDPSTTLPAVAPLGMTQGAQNDIGIELEGLAQVKAYAARLGQIMWEHAGIVRNPEGLREAKRQIISIPAKDYRVQHRQLVCYKIVNACLARSESLGCHYITSDL